MTRPNCGAVNASERRINLSFAALALLAGLIIAPTSASAQSLQNDPIFDRWGNLERASEGKPGGPDQAEGVKAAERLNGAGNALSNGPGRLRAAGGVDSRSPRAPENDLNVRIVIQTSPNVYALVNVPQGTVVSAPPSPPSIINCPTSAGTAEATTADCFEPGLPSTSNIKLVAPTYLAPNAQFYQWRDIPGSTGLSISNACTYSSYMPNMNCTMAGPRFIQAVYKCSDTYVFNAVSKQCEQPKEISQTACYKYAPHLTACSLGLTINRGTTGANTYVVASSPQAINPSVNIAPSSAGNCVNPGNSTVLQTNCSQFYNAYPTSVTLTASSSTGVLPVSFTWSGACSGSNAVCVVSVVQGVPVHAVANFSH